MIPVVGTLIVNEIKWLKRQINSVDFPDPDHHTSDPDPPEFDPDVSDTLDSSVHPVSDADGSDDVDGDGVVNIFDNLT